MVVETKRPCPACGNSTGEKLYKVSMLLPKDFCLDGDYDIISCDKCGCCYGEVLSTEDDYNHYYSKQNYYGGWQANSSSSYDIDVVIRSIGQLIPKSAKIIDVGFGNGKLLVGLRESGYSNLLGIDPSDRSVKSLEEQGVPGWVGSIYDAALADKEKADVVIFTMVLEHLLKPEKAIMAIKNNLLKKDGYLVVTWPYFDDLFADNSPMVNNFNHEHINFFSRQTADVLFDSIGFQSISHHISLGVCKNQALQFSNVAVYGGGRTVEQHRIVRDEQTKESILEYCARVSKQEKYLLNRIEIISKSEANVVVWGVGAYFYHLMKVSVLADCRIPFMVDGNPAKQGRKVFGYEIKSPETLRDFEGTIIIAAMLYSKEIKEEIASMGNSKIEVMSLG